MPRDCGARSGVLALVGTMSLTLSTCGQGEDLAGPDPAALQVTTQTSGTGTDPDGYTVSIDSRLPVPIALVDTLLESNVTPGEHTVDLGGISAGCAVQGGGARTLTAEVGTTASADFTVICTAPEVPQGAVLVAVTTSGVELDADGYVVSVDPSTRRSVGVSDEIRIEGVPAGERSIRLSGLAANCSVQGQNPRTIDVSTDGEASVGFAVRCWPPATGSIAFSGSDSIEVIGADGVPRRDFTSSVPGGRPSWSPDGRFLAFVGSLDEGEPAVFVQPLSGGAAAELPGCVPSGFRPIWSPDGNRLLCLSELGRLSSVDRDGSDLRFLTPDDGRRVTSAHYLPDGRIFFVADENGDDQEGGFGAFRVGADGTDLTRLFTLPEEFTEGWAVPSPDGQRVAYILRDFFTGRFGLNVASIDGTNPRPVSPALDVTELAWSPDGSRLAFGVFGERSSPLWLVNPDGADLAQVPLPGELGFDWSPDGTRLVVAVGFVDADGLHSNIYTIRADMSGLERLTASGTVDVDPAWGRDAQP
jgi:Tol biopolymer transport system component